MALLHPSVSAHMALTSDLLLRGGAFCPALGQRQQHMHLEAVRLVRRLGWHPRQRLQDQCQAGRRSYLRVHV